MTSARRPSPRAHQRGLGMVELMIGVALGMLATGIFIMTKMARFEI